MGKRLFEILDEMNVSDTLNSTANVGVCTTFVSATKAKGGAHITLGASEEMLMKLMNDELIPILVLVNREEYFAKEKEL
jgi:hypothetical protein